jgi:hypothetical protein
LGKVAPNSPAQSTTCGSDARGTPSRSHKASSN